MCTQKYITYYVHSNLNGEYILLKTKTIPHINSLDELVNVKIPALSGRGAENNRLILKNTALNGPMLKYGIHKNIQIGRYSTVSRRVDNLTERFYLGEAGKRATERGKQTEESMFGLTWRGFIASITIKEVRENILQVLRSNSLLAFPEKETVLLILEELVTQQELETIARSVLEAFLRTIPNLELVDNASLLAWLLAIREKPELPDSFKLSKIPKDAWELLDRPTILKVVKEKIIPLVKQKTREITVMYQIFSVLNEVGNFISDLEVENQPSKKVKEFIKTMSSQLSNLDEITKEER